MAIPVSRRDYDAFLSYAHTDRDFVDGLYRWMSEVAGLNIWYDAKRMPGGEPVGSGLQTAILNCRGVLLIASAQAITRGWVQDEIGIARQQRNAFRDFRIVPLRLSGAPVDDLIIGPSWIDVPNPLLDANTAAAVLNAFYPGNKRPDPRTSRDVYVSGSWQSTDNASALAVWRSVADSNLRMIGDSKDQKGFKANRIQSIIESCGAFVGVIPFRDNIETASATEKPYKYFLTELDLATAANLPTLVIADPRVHRTDGDDRNWLRMDTQAAVCPPNVQSAINDLWTLWVPPPRPHYVFLAVDLESPCARRDSDVRQLIERVTGMKTVVGYDIEENDLQLGIQRALQQAFLVIADISGSTGDSFNLDVCIEAGMAIASETELAMIARGNQRRPPFMLRRAGQLRPYADDVEQLGVIHRIIREYRRRVVNAELD